MRIYIISLYAAVREALGECGTRVAREPGEDEAGIFRGSTLARSPARQGQTGTRTLPTRPPSTGHQARTPPRGNR